MKSLLSILLLLFVFHTMVFAQTTQPTSQPVVQHGMFDRLLQKYVTGEKVDYLGIKQHDKKNLASYLSAMSQVQVENLDRNDQLAYYINVYNATMVQAVIDRYHKGYSPAEKDFQVFKTKLVRLKTGTVSLNDLENKIIRPTFKDPRIHVALVCGAVSCPPLLNRAYVGSTLNVVLENKMRHWLNDEPFRNRFDPKKHVLYLSQIFKWYAKDFNKNGNARAYVSRYMMLPANRVGLEFLPYDWSLNIK